MMNEKTIWKSKTLWLAIATMLVGILQAVSAFPWGDYLSPETSGILLTGLGVAMYVLRLVTSQRIK